MGFGLTELIIVFIIVILVFGTKKLRSLGGDLGTAIKSFRSAVKEDDDEDADEDLDETREVIRKPPDDSEKQSPS